MSQCNHDAVLVISIFCGFSVLIALAVMYGFRSLRHQNEALKSENATLKFAASPEGHDKEKALSRQKNYTGHIFHQLRELLVGFEVKSAGFRSGKFAPSEIEVFDLKNEELVLRIKISAFEDEALRCDAVYLDKLGRQGFGYTKLNDHVVQNFVERVKKEAQVYTDHYSFNSSPHGD